MNFKTYLPALGAVVLGAVILMVAGLGLPGRSCRKNCA